MQRSDVLVHDDRAGDGAVLVAQGRGCVDDGLERTVEAVDSYQLADAGLALVERASQGPLLGRYPLAGTHPPAPVLPELGNANAVGTAPDALGRRVMADDVPR